MEREGRLAGADFMRALACMIVLTHHLVLRFDFSKLPHGLATAFTIGRFGNCGVSLFFVLSGSLLARPFWLALDKGGPMPSLRIYAMRRAARILPGFWVALTAGFVLSFTLKDIPLDRELIGRYVSGFLLMSQWHWRTFFPVEGDGPLWSIPFEATSYVLLPLGFALLFRWRPALVGRVGARAAWLGVIALTLFCHWLIINIVSVDDVGRGWIYGNQGGAKEWMPRYNPIGFFGIFATGALTAGIQTLLPSRRALIFDAIGLAALVFGAAQLYMALGGAWESYGWLDIPYRFPYLPLAVGTVLCTFPNSVFVGRLLDRRVIRFIATISFGIYVWQEIVISLIFHAGRRLGVSPETVIGPWLAFAAIAVTIIVAIATLSYVFLERPVMQWARAMEDRKHIALADAQGSLRP